MPITDATQATNKFMEDLRSGKLKKEKIPNPPPYFEGTKEQIQEDSKAFNEFLQSDLFDLLKNL